MLRALADMDFHPDAKMATVIQHQTESPARRVVLVDFDWQDADLVAELLRRPGLSVRLVAGQKPDDPGLRLAELCGLPRTVDLADLTREIFDLALVSERSPRRTQVEGLLLALGTPCSSPQSFLSEPAPAPESTPAIVAPLALHAAAFETTIGGESFGALVEQALPDLTPDAPTEPTPVQVNGERQLHIPSLEDFPSPEDRQGLEQALRSLVENTGASGAELHTGTFDHIELVAQVGPQDPLLQGLIDVALELGTPQVVSRLAGPLEGKAWGAWPFRTTQRRGVLAAAAIDPAEGWATWEKVVEELRATWDERDRERAGPAFPLIPQPSPGWLDAEAFRSRLDLAVERNGRDRLRFAVHRLEFPQAAEPLQALCEQLPSQLRDTDCICRPAAETVVLLTAGPAETFVHVRRRLQAIWEKVWDEAQLAPPASPFIDQHVELAGPEDAAGFLAAARAWLLNG